MKSRNIPALAVFALLAIAITIPVAALAKDKESNGKDNGNSNRNEKAIVASTSKSDDNDKDDNKGNDQNKQNNKDSQSSCFKAFGHLFAPGWVKHNGPVSISESCNLPFGIGKKFKGNNASSTPDVTAPVISNITTKAALHQAEVRWTTNERTDSTIFWSTTSPVDTGSSTTKSSRNALTMDHRLVIRNLSASTTYHVIVRSKDAAGNVTTSGEQTFTTKGPAADTSVPTISSIITLSGTTTVRVAWATNENTNGRVYYSTGLPVNLTSAPFVDEATSTKTHAILLTGLASSTTYYMVIESADASGNVSTSATFTAATIASSSPSVDTTAPVISNVTTAIGSTTITVGWNTNEASASKVFYSLITPIDLTASTTPYVGDATLVSSHSVALTGLATSTPYHFTIQATDGSGNVATTTEMTVTTLVN